MEKKPTKAISPVSHEYLTKGKEYTIKFIKESYKKEYGYYFHIIDDTGHVVISHEHKSLHIEDKSWILK